MVVNFVILVALIILIGFALSILAYCILELCHISNDIKIEKWKKRRREYLYGTGYTREDIDESVRY